MDKGTTRDTETIVTFTGGLGAQILSAAIYFDLHWEGRKIYADLEYFKKSAKMATVGNKGEISHWDYELEAYALPLSAFSLRTPKTTLFKRNKPTVIADGGDKLRLAIKALRKPEIRKHFPVSQAIMQECQRIIGNRDYLCIHIRRGDYVNVASHLVDDMDFVNMARTISRFVPSVVVISDSEVSAMTRRNLNELFEHCSFVVGGNPHIGHNLIRQANYLICSNSQFSLSAALLNEVSQQIFLPTKWFGDGESDLQIPINEICQFQMLTRL